MKKNARVCEKTIPPLLSSPAGHAAALPVHVSATSHGPALARHVVPLLPGVCTHSRPVGNFGLHLSTVHGLKSSHSPSLSHSQLSAAPTHAPNDVHVLTLVHTSPSLQLVPTGLGTSGGHAAETPVQYSPASHGVLMVSAARHNTVLGLNVLAGQDG